jgi:preprotein translocase subunit YajC
MPFPLVLAATTTTQSSPATFLLPLILMGGIFYFLLIRPQQKRTRQQRDLLSNIEVGDEVLTIGGIFGVVRDIDEETVTVEISPGTQVKLVRNGIARKLEEEQQPEGPWSDEEGGEASDSGENKGKDKDG